MTVLCAMTVLCVPYLGEQAEATLPSTLRCDCLICAAMTVLYVYNLAMTVLYVPYLGEHAEAARSSALRHHRHKLLKRDHLAFRFRI